MIAPEDFKGVNCQWIKCIAGMGLAGRGICFKGGNWRLAKCPKYENEDIFCAIEEWACEWEFLAGLRPRAWRFGDNDKNPLWLW